MYGISHCALVPCCTQISHYKHRHVKLTVGNCAIVGGQSVGLPIHSPFWLWRLCGITFRVGIAQPIGCNLEGERIAIDRSGRIVCAQVPRRRSIGQRPSDGTDHPRPTQLSREGTGRGGLLWAGSVLQSIQCTSWEQGPGKKSAWGARKQKQDGRSHLGVPTATDKV